MKINAADFKNIIFDFGGVILNIDYTLTSSAFKKLGIKDFDSFYSKASQNDLFDNLETGSISPTELISALKKHLPETTTDTEILSAWNAMLLDLPKERLDLLLKLKESHTTFLLSNTNTIHIDAFQKYIKEKFGSENLNPYFQKVYFSSSIGMRKPNSDIFLFVLKENNLKAEETLFIDDSPQHVEGAREAGLHAYHLDVTKESILDIFV